LCEIGNSRPKELLAKSADQLSSVSPLRRRQNQRAPPRPASAAAIAPFFGRFASSTPGTTSFAFRFATRLPTCHTVQPRIAFRLFRTPMPRAYPSESLATHSRTPPPERRPVERGLDWAGAEEQARSARC